MDKKIPMRQCVGCGSMKPKKEMMRVIKQKTGEIRLDVTGKMNGRGAYICKSASCLDAARKSRGLERSFGMRISDEIYENLQKEFTAYNA